MEYHFVVKWSKENGWQFDWDTLDAWSPDGNVFAPNLGEWLKPVVDSETGDIEMIVVNQLETVFNSLNEEL